jgi:hypothetical protein
MRPQLDLARFPRANPGSSFDARLPDMWASSEQVAAMHARIDATWVCPRGVSRELEPFYKQCRADVEFVRLNEEAARAVRTALLNEPRQWIFAEITGPHKRDIVRQAEDVVDALIAFVYSADGRLDTSRARAYANAWMGVGGCS